LEAIDELIRKDNEQIMLRIALLQINAKQARNELLSGAFQELINREDRDQRIRYISQFIPLINDLVLFPDDELLKKLRTYGFSNTVIKWFTPLTDILSELDKLRNLDGVFFVLQGFLFASLTHLQLKIRNEIIESFDLHVKHGKNEESNILHKMTDNFIRKLAYNEKNNLTPKLNQAEKVLFDIIKETEYITNREFDFRSFMRDASMGEFEGGEDFFLTFKVFDTSKNKVYAALFDLVKLTYKDKEMMTQEEFENQEELSYNGSYHLYRASRVKKILLKK
jgi:hypothetical protein